VPKLTFGFSPEKKIQSLEALPGFLLAQLKKYATWGQLGPPRALHFTVIVYSSVMHYKSKATIQHADFELGLAECRGRR